MKTQLIQWNDIYSSGNEKLDEDHKHFAKIINDLFSAFTEGIAQEGISNSLEELKSYSVSHFEYEENLLEEIKFSDIESHKHEHEEFMTKINEFQTMNNEENQEVHYKLIQFMKSWFNNHIVKEAQDISSMK
ncbi:MAG: bacteriohemerythrin [Bacteroidota bacterium]|nr:bacteriohemerythrin [Bacteroidota bacterium]